VSDWFKQLPDSYDVIVSNPPYIRQDDPHLSALGDEPQTALIAKSEGLADIQTIIAEAPQHLAGEGVLLIEHGYDQASLVAALFAQHGFTNVQLHRDLADQPRVTLGTLAQ